VLEFLDSEVTDQPQKSYTHSRTYMQQHRHTISSLLFGNGRTLYTVGSENDLGLHSSREGLILVKYLFDQCNSCMFFIRLFVHQYFDLKACLDPSTKKVCNKSNSNLVLVSANFVFAKRRDTPWKVEENFELCNNINCYQIVVPRYSDDVQRILFDFFEKYSKLDLRK